MHIGTNKPNTKLTRPVATWKRVIAGIACVGFILAALSAFASGAGWVTIIPVVFAIGCFVFASEKYETIG